MDSWALAQPEDIDRVLKDFVVARTGRDIALQPSTRIDELDIDSIGFMELIGYLEQECDRPMPDEALAALNTVADLHALCTLHGVWLPEAGSRQEETWVLNDDPDAPASFEAVAAVLDGGVGEATTDDHVHKVQNLVLGLGTCDIVISQRAFEVRFGDISGRHRYVAFTAPSVVGEVLRLAGVDRVIDDHHGPLGPGHTGGPPESLYHCEVPQRSVWVQRHPTSVRIAIRETSETPIDGFPSPLGSV